MRKLWGASNVRVYGGGSARTGLPLRPREADRRIQPPGLERPQQPASPERHQREHQLAADPNADPDHRRPGRLAARPDHRDALPGAPPVLRGSHIYWWNTPQAAQIRASIALHDPPAVPRRAVTPHIRCRRHGGPTPALSNSAPVPEADRLAAGPLIEQTVRSVLEQHIASASPARRLTVAPPDCLTTTRFEQLAVPRRGAPARRTGRGARPCTT